jgi:hypothetical protein
VSTFFLELADDHVVTHAFLVCFRGRRTLGK